MKVRLALAANNTEKCFQHNIFGLNSNSQRVWQRFVSLTPGDILVFYKAKEGFAGICQVLSEVYKDTTPIWEDNVYPNRVRI
jgi:predicted RNA-binding protein with PUA-like domain